MRPICFQLLIEAPEVLRHESNIHSILYFLTAATLGGVCYEGAPIRSDLAVNSEW